MKTSNAIARAVWGARYPNGFGDRPVPFTEWWLHHSVTIAPDLVPPFDDDDFAIRQLESIGQSRFGGGISYTVPITPYGRVYEGLGLQRRGAHTLGHNTAGAAIVFVGDYERNPVPSPMIEAAAQTMVLAHRMGAAKTHQLNGGHRDVGSTSCPGKYAYGKIEAINARARVLWDGGFGKKPGVVASAIPKIVKVVTRNVLLVDGVLGPRTIRQWQRVLGTPVDGLISQPSALVRKVQQVVNTRVDGFLGPKTWAAIQRHLGVRVDGVPGPVTIKALQRRLNTGRF